MNKNIHNQENLFKYIQKKCEGYLTSDGENSNIVHVRKSLYNVKKDESFGYVMDFCIKNFKEELFVKNYCSDQMQLMITLNHIAAICDNDKILKIWNHIKEDRIIKKNNSHFFINSFTFDLLMLMIHNQNVNFKTLVSIHNYFNKNLAYYNDSFPIETIITNIEKHHNYKQSASYVLVEIQEMYEN